MRKSMVALLAVVSMVALLAGGCSSNSEAVKKDAASAPATVAPAADKAVEPAKPVQAAEVVKPVEQPKIVENVKEVAAPQKTAKPAETQASSAPAVEVGFETVYFDFDKSDLRQDARDVLSKNAETALKALAGAKIKIEGHCDERGSAEYNMALGERRAKSVQTYLTTLGVKGDTLSIISYGKEKPAVTGSDEAAWAKNRRAEFVIVK